MFSLWAYAIVLQDPEGFYTSQVPTTAPAATVPFPAQAQLLLGQLHNIYLLLAGLAIVCCWTSDRTVARNYLLVVALADLGHIYTVYKVFGYEKFMNLGSWNDATWGNVGVSVFLHVNRLATVLGVFGRTGR